MPPEVLAPPTQSAAGEILDGLLPDTAAVTASIGDSAVMLDPAEKQKELEALWSQLHPDDPAPPMPAAQRAGPRALPDHLGPFNWNPIVFGGGVPVGGWAQLTLFQNGAVNFAGHFHDSGFPSYNVTCVFAVRNADGVAYTFVRSGRCHGTTESGSRNFDWGDNPTQTAVAAGWAALSRQWAWQARASANADIGSLVDQAVKALGQVASVVAIIA
jgi:hypothetical protein